jgi:hypothetical protein
MPWLRLGDEPGQRAGQGHGADTDPLAERRGAAQGVIAGEAGVGTGWIAGIHAANIARDP